MASEALTATVTLLFCDLVESTALRPDIGDTAATNCCDTMVFDALRGRDHLPTAGPR